MSDNLYSVLGVDESAEIEVINAAHKALAKKYHPDTFQGDKKFAEEKLKNINSAFDVLSDPQKRKQYDEELYRDDSKPDFDGDDEGFSGEDFGEDVLIEDWSVVVEVYPDAEFVRKSLFSLSPKLSFTFQIVILSSKSAAQSIKIGEVLKTEFLTKYFGKSTKLHLFVERLLLNGKRDIAAEINKKIVILGSDASDKVIEDVKVRHKENLREIYLKTGTLAENINRLRDAEKRAAYAERQKAAQREKYGDATDKSRGYDNTSARQTKPQPMGAGFFFMCLLLGLFLLLFIMAAIYL